MPHVQQTHGSLAQTKLIPALIRLPFLQRVFFTEPSRALDALDVDEEVKDLFISQARAVFDACPCLTEVGDIDADPTSRYVTAIAERGEDGGLEDVKVGMGNGMVIGQEDLAFPRSYLH